MHYLVMDDGVVISLTFLRREPICSILLRRFWMNVFYRERGNGFFASVPIFAVSVGGGSEGEQQIQQQVQLHSPTTPFPIMLHRFHLHLIIF